MAVLDLERDAVVIRIVYDGPPFAGKTTSMRALARSLGRSMDSPGETAGRTVFFDWMEYTGGLFDGHQIHCQIVSVPGHGHLASRRRALLDAADVVVFVADTSDRIAFERSLERVRDLVEILRGHGDPPIGLVVQANKRDLPGALPRDELRAALGDDFARVALTESVADAGEGIRETFVFAVRLALDRIRELMTRGALPRGKPTVDTARDLLGLLEQLLPAVPDGPPAAPERPAAVLARPPPAVEQPPPPPRERAPAAAPGGAPPAVPSRSPALEPAVQVRPAAADRRTAPPPLVARPPAAVERIAPPPASSAAVPARPPAAVDRQTTPPPSFARPPAAVQPRLAPPAAPPPGGTPPAVLARTPTGTEQRHPPLPHRQSSVIPVRPPTAPERQSSVIPVRPPTAPERQSSVIPVRPPTAPERQSSVIPVRPPTAPERQSSAPSAVPSAVQARPAALVEPRPPPLPERQPAAANGAPSAGQARPPAVEPRRPPEPERRPEATPTAAASDIASAVRSVMPAARPRLPDPRVPSGTIWPPVEGRMVLHEATSHELMVHRAGADWVAGLGTGWRLHSAAAASFTDFDDGRQTLLAWARLHAAHGELLSPSRCVVLAAADDETWRLWQIVKTAPALRAWLLDAAAHDAADLIDRLASVAAALADAYRRLADHRLVLGLDTVGRGARGVQFVALMPGPDAASPPRPADVAEHIVHELSQVLAGELATRRSELAQRIARRRPVPGSAPWDDLVAAAITDSVPPTLASVAPH